MSDCQKPSGTCYDPLGLTFDGHRAECSLKPASSCFQRPSGRIHRLVTNHQGGTMKRTIGLLAAALYIGTVIAANYAIGHWGTQAFPHGPHTIPVGFGYTAPSGVLFVSIALVTRDLVQWAMGRPAKPRLIDVAAMLALIGLAAGVSFAVSAAAVAAASALAFGCSELLDFGLFTWVAPRWGRAVLAGGLAGAVADSLIFLYVAFGSFAFWQGQVLGKSYGIVIAATIIAARRAWLRPALVTA